MKLVDNMPQLIKALLRSYREHTKYQLLCKTFFCLCSWFILSTYIKLLHSTLFGILFGELPV